MKHAHHNKFIYRSKPVQTEKKTYILKVSLKDNILFYGSVFNEIINSQFSKLKSRHPFESNPSRAPNLCLGRFYPFKTTPLNTKTKLDYENKNFNEILTQKDELDTLDY